MSKRVNRMARLLITGDLHLTDRPQDEYRWAFLDWLHKEAVVRAADAVVILGDLTDAKDYHSSRLVNRVVTALTNQSRVYSTVILRGNHDGIDEHLPYFTFLNEVPGIAFVREAGTLVFDDTNLPNVLLMPHRKDVLPFWKHHTLKLDSACLVLGHVTVDGALGENGMELKGVNLRSYLKTQEFDKIPIISGDVHVPQQCGGVTYVGSPYPIRFGDDFQPRILQVDFTNPTTFTMESVFCPAWARKLSLNLSGVECELPSLGKKDQVKIAVTLMQKDLHLWPKVRERITKEVEESGSRLHSLQLFKLSEVSLKAAQGHDVSRKRPEEERIPLYVAKKGAPEDYATEGVKIWKGVKNEA